jgi:hypothetical protein
MHPLRGTPLLATRDHAAAEDSHFSKVKAKSGVQQATPLSQLKTPKVVNEDLMTT